RLPDRINGAGGTPPQPSVSGALSGSVGAGPRTRHGADRGAGDGGFGVPANGLTGRRARQGARGRALLHGGPASRQEGGQGQGRSQFHNGLHHSSPERLTPG